VVAVSSGQKSGLKYVIVSLETKGTVCPVRLSEWLCCVIQ
jgi:hypothetical protein